MKKYSDKETYDVDIKKHKPETTNPQKRLYWKTLTHFARAIGVWEEDALHYLHEGIKEKYGMRKSAPLFSENGEHILVPIGLSECNRFEEYEALFEGIFIEAGEQGVDMRDFIREWEEIKKDAKTNMRPVSKRNDGSKE